MTNTDPWPSIKNLSVHYAEYVGRLLGLQKQRISKEDILEQYAYAYEKLDGTNLGIKCDGTIYGRRLKLEDGATQYQKVPLGQHNIPSTQTIQSIKASLLKEVSQHVDMEGAILPKLMLYGELMCNDRYGYGERKLTSKWLCFGAILIFNIDHSSDIIYKISDRLSDQGFLALKNTKISILLKLNPTMEGILKEYGIECPTLLDQGLVKDICLRQKEVMMESNLEGMVLTGKTLPILKWKTGVEDESKGFSLLASALAETERITSSDMKTEKGHVNTTLLKCLTEVAGAGGNKKKVWKNSDKTEKKKIPPKYLFDEEVLEKAKISALTKYDSMETYFDVKGGMKWIVGALTKEIAEDVEATSSEEIKSIEKYVRVEVGYQIKQWKTKVT